MAAAFLVDTHALLWWLSGDRRLPRPSRDRIADPENRALASAASAWEVAIKTALGKLEAPRDFVAAVEESGLTWIPVEPREAYAAGWLPGYHRDPFDRLLIAQCVDRALSVISHDHVFDRYAVRRVWR
jgi:PIN domain nuclease of toxin-antitoxin system